MASFLLNVDVRSQSLGLYGDGSSCDVRIVVTMCLCKCLHYEAVLSNFEWLGINSACSCWVGAIGGVEDGCTGRYATDADCCHTIGWILRDDWHCSILYLALGGCKDVHGIANDGESIVGEVEVTIGNQVVARQWDEHVLVLGTMAVDSVDAITYGSNHSVVSNE